MKQIFEVEIVSKHIVEIEAKDGSEATDILNDMSEKEILAELDEPKSQTLFSWTWIGEYK